MEDKKEQIVQTFEKHFKHHGFKKTSVDDIAAELQISKKTIYKYFNSKEKIFYFIISRVAKGLSKKTEKKLAGFSTYEEKIVQLINQIFEETRKWLQKGNDAFEFKYKYEISELAFKEAYNEIIRKWIQEGIKNQEFQSVNIELIVRFINGLFSESMKLVSANPELRIEEEVRNAVLKLLK